jgi:hypothetical protein
MSKALQVVKVAEEFAERGYKELGKDNTIFGKWYGANLQPWCGMFISWCFTKVGATSLVAAQTAKGFSGCTAAVKWFKANKRLVAVAKAQPGDIVFMSFIGKNRFDHVGLVTANDPKSKVLHTVEGNTVNPNGLGDQAGGDGVYFKTRPYRFVTAVARPDWALIEKDK